jgi:hypothetical protein
VGNGLLYALKKGIGNDFTSEVRKAWIEVYKIISEVTGSHTHSSLDISTYKNKKITNTEILFGKNLLGGSLKLKEIIVIKTPIKGALLVIHLKSTNTWQIATIVSP